jgi:amino acid permease
VRRVSIRILSGVVGVALVALGVVYLTVACESLPAFLGGTAGDTSPRTGLGIVALAVAAGVGLGLVITRRRRPDDSSS